jgi:hypothetical protein
MTDQMEEIEPSLLERLQELVAAGAPHADAGAQSLQRTKHGDLFCSRLEFSLGESTRRILVRSDLAGEGDHVSGIILTSLSQSRPAGSQGYRPDSCKIIL